MIEVKQIDRESITHLVQGLDDFEKDKSINQGLKAGGDVIKMEGKRNLRKVMRKPKGVTGNLLRSFHVRTKRHKLGVLIGFKRSNKNMIIGGGNHAHLVDRGTDRRETKGYKSLPAGLDRGIMKPTHFWLDTEAQAGDKAIEEVYTGVERAINRIKNRR